MHANVSADANLPRRCAHLLREMARTLVAEPQSGPAQALVDEFVASFAPAQRLQGTSQLLWSAMATPSSREPILSAVGTAATRQDIAQSQVFSAALAAASPHDSQAATNAAQRQRLLQVGHSVCAGLVARLAGLDPETHILPESLHDCVHRLLHYTHPPGDMEAVVRQAAVYRALMGAQASDDHPASALALCARADREVETAWRDRIMAKAMEWLAPDDWVRAPRERARESSPSFEEDLPLREMP